MFRLIEFLLHGCFHFWKLIDAIPHSYIDFSGAKVNGNYMLQECEKCGRLKVHYFTGWWWRNPSERTS